jgi:nucleotide-binding universal stress UspA family protein
MYRVLVATDGSPAALRALRFAHDAVRGRGQGRLHALSVLVPAAEIDRVLDAEGRAMREAVESTLGPQAASIDFEALPGHAPRTIVERAKALGVDEIVMGTRGRGPVAGLLLGSVAARVVQLAHCPVTLVR